MSMRVEYTRDIRPGMTLVVGGWVVVVEQSDGRLRFEGVLPDRQSARFLAGAVCDGKKWHVWPVTGQVTAHQMYQCPDTGELVIGAGL